VKLYNLFLETFFLKMSVNQISYNRNIPTRSPQDGYRTVDERQLHLFKEGRRGRPSNCK
jgi:hypothetical protein